MDIPDCFYRVSVKALVLDPSRERFLVLRQADGMWDLPGGGLDWGMEPEAELRREIREEMGLEVQYVEKYPCYFFADAGAIPGGWWRANVMYETTLAHLNFTPSDECVSVRFVSKDEAFALTPQHGNVQMLGKLFDPYLHA